MASTRPLSRRIVRGLVFALLAGALLLALATMDRWLFTVLDPGPCTAKCEGGCGGLSQ